MDELERKFSGPPPEYWAMIEEEKRAEKKIWELADKFAEECFSLWRKGDGCGGYVLDVIKEAFYKRGAEKPVISDSTNRKKIDAKIRTMVFERDAYRCVKCSSYKDLCLDHIYPHSLGGSSEPENLQTLCWNCNSKKGAKVEEAA